MRLEQSEHVLLLLLGLRLRLDLLMLLDLFSLLDLLLDLQLARQRLLVRLRAAGQAQRSQRQEEHDARS